MEDDYDSVPNSWEEYERWREQIATYGRPLPGFNEKVDLAREQRALSAQRTKEYEARRACHQAGTEHVRERAKAREQLAKLKMEVCRLQAERDAKAVELKEAERSKLALVESLITLHNKLQPALIESYEKTELTQVIEQVVRDNPELRCPVCDHSPTRLYGDVGVCPACNWNAARPALGHDA